MKTLERHGKSTLIDSFTTKAGLSRGAHRAGDCLHDPLAGFFLAIKEMGFKEACKKWPKHMASDLVTPMSLPLPWTFLFKNDSWIVQMYAKGLLNFRTGVITPGFGVLITDLETRYKGRKLSDEELDITLQQAHLTAGLISAGAAALLSLGLVEVSAPFMVALLASAVWSAITAAFYWLKRHRKEIAKAGRALKEHLEGSLKTGATDLEWTGVRQGRPRVSLPTRAYEATPNDRTIAPSAAPSKFAIATVAAAMAFILVVGSPTRA